MWCIVWLPVLYMTGVRVASAPPEVKSLDVTVGGTVTFPASVKRNGYFIKHLTLITVNNRNALYVNTHRAKWDSSTGMFSITDLLLSDSGLYRIQNNDEHTAVMYDYSLTVYKPVSKPAVVRLHREDGVCALACTEQNGTGVTLTWYLKDHAVQSASGLLELKDRRAVDKYSCVAKNPVSKEETSLSYDICPISHTVIITALIISSVILGLVILGAVLMYLYRRNKCKTVLHMEISESCTETANICSRIKENAEKSEPTAEDFKPFAKVLMDNANSIKQKADKLQRLSGGIKQNAENLLYEELTQLSGELSLIAGALEFVSTEQTELSKVLSWITEKLQKLADKLTKKGLELKQKSDKSRPITNEETTLVVEETPLFVEETPLVVVLQPLPDSIKQKADAIKQKADGIKQKVDELQHLSEGIKQKVDEIQQLSGELHELSGELQQLSGES